MASLEDLRIGTRLRNVRENLGLTLVDVSNRLGYNNYQTLASIEKGERSIKVAELTKLSMTYCRDFWYFLAEEEPTESVIELAWREKRSGLEYGDIEARIRELVDNYQLLEDINGIQKRSLDFVWEPSISLTLLVEAGQRADALVRDLDLGYRPAVNLSEVMEERLGIKTLFWDLRDYGSGVCALYEDSIAVIVNAYDCEGRRNFDMAHELFHVYASKIYPFNASICQEDSTEFEKLANEFAAALLMPAESVKREFLKIIHDNRFSPFDLIPIAQDFKVSNIALLWRLKNLGLIKKDTVDKIKDSPKFAEVNRATRSEKNTTAPLFSHRFVCLGLKALRDGKISKGKFCRIFGKSRHEFSSFITLYDFSEEWLYDNEEQSDYS